MRYAQLRAFHHVAITGGFSRAAEALNQSQPSISDQVRKLEEAHDILLFHRDTRQVRLTEAGQGLLRLTRKFFETEGEIANYLDLTRAVPAGQLRIVADSAAHITPAISQYCVAYPGVKVSLWTANTQDVLARLRNYDAEIGVVGNLGSTSDLDRIELERSPIVAIASRDMIPGNPPEISFEALAKWPLIFREPGSRTREHLEAAADHLGITLSPAIQVEGREAMREVVATGAGVGFLSEAEFGNDRRLRKIRITDVELGMAETLVTLSARRDVPVIRAFVKVLGESGIRAAG